MLFLTLLTISYTQIILKQTIFMFKEINFLVVR